MEVNEKTVASKVQFSKDHTDLESVLFTAEIPIEQVSIASYQRKCNMIRVKKIIKEFDVHRMKPIDVSYRDGKYYVWDGQHRYEAYKMMKKVMIPATIHLNLSEHDEALLFAHQSDNVSAVTTCNKWIALESADDPSVVRIVGIANKHGFKIKGHHPGAYQIKHNTWNNVFECVGTIFNTYNKYGETMLDNVFGVIEGAWDNEQNMTHNTIFNALVLLFETYGNHIDAIALSKCLSNTTPAKLLRDMDGTKELLTVGGKHKRCATYIVSLYNKIRRGRNSLSAIDLLAK